MKVDAVCRIVVIAPALALCLPASAANPTPSPSEASARPGPSPTPAVLAASTRFSAAGSLPSPDPEGDPGQGPLVVSNETLAALASRGRLSVAPVVGGPAPALPAPRSIEKIQADRDRWRRKAAAQETRAVSLERQLARADRDVQVLRQSSNEAARQSLEQAEEKRRLLAEQVASARAEQLLAQRMSRE